jgi:hypothetical protein
MTPEESAAHQKRYSASHATVQLIEAIRGIAPTQPAWNSGFERPVDKVACPETFVYALRVWAFDVRPEVNCEHCLQLIADAKAGR